MNRAKFFIFTFVGIWMFYVQGRTRYLLALVVAFLLSMTGARGQIESELSYPENGKVIADYTFSDVDYYSKNKVSINEFRGRWLILDFWERFCVSCIAGMPELNRLQTEMGDKLQILLVGLNFTPVWAAEKKSHPGWTGDDFSRMLYRQIRERDGVNLPVAWDTALFQRFLGSGVPLTIVVSPSGVVHAITTGINRSQLETLMAGEYPPMLPYRLDIPKLVKSKYNYELPLLSKGQMANGGVDTSFVFRDIFARADSGTLYAEGVLFKGGTFSILDEPLGVFYKIAYSGKDAWDNYDTMRYGRILEKVIYKTKDSLALHLGQRYCYSLTLYKNAGERFTAGSAHDHEMLQGFLKRDLEVNFRYKASLEDTTVDILELVISDSAKASGLSSKGGPRKMRVYSSQIEVRNTSMNEFAIRILQRTLQHHMYVVNKTGIQGNIDMEVSDIPMGTLNDVNGALGKVGLYLRMARKSMKVVVVRD